MAEIPIISNFEFWHVIFTTFSPSFISKVISLSPSFETISLRVFEGSVILPSSSTCASTRATTVKSKSVATSLIVPLSTVSIKMFKSTGWRAFMLVARSTILIPLYKSSFLTKNFISYSFKKYSLSERII